MLQPVTVIAIYLIVWFVCLFIVLPFGVHNQVDAGEVVRGTEPGAPVSPRLLRRLLVTSLLAAAVTALLFWGLGNPVLQQYWS
jgi:predicted secreted protein